jgi:hypothetical protein
VRSSTGVPATTPYDEAFSLPIRIVPTTLPPPRRCRASISWATAGVSPMTMSSPQSIAKGSVPTSGRACRTACPFPLASCWTTTRTVAKRSGRFRSSMSSLRNSTERRRSRRSLGRKYASSASFPGAFTMTTREIPAAANSATTSSMTGVSMIGRSSFGTVRLIGRKRVPRPPAGMTPYVTGLTRGEPSLTDGSRRSR